MQLDIGTIRVQRLRLVDSDYLDLSVSWNHSHPIITMLMLVRPNARKKSERMPTACMD